MSANPEDATPLIPATTREKSDLLLALAYLAVYSVSIAATMGRGYDELHGATLLVNALRALDGQVPFRDFFPWYGPLFTYFSAFWVWLLGRDLLAIKLFTDLVTPWLCMLILVAALRGLRLAWPQRLFVVAVSCILGVDRLFGATRSFLGLLLLGMWIRNLGLRGSRLFWARAAVFPSLLLTLLYSPEIGVLMVGVALILAITEIAPRTTARERMTIGFGYMCGMALASAVFVLLCRLEAVRTYLQFASYTSANMGWAYGNPFPRPARIFDSPANLLYYLHLLALFLAGAWLLYKMATRRFAEIPRWFPAMLAYGASLWPSSFFRIDLYHVLFALPPVVICLAHVFLRSSPRLWRKWLCLVASSLALVVWGWKDFRVYWFEFRDPAEVEQSTRPFAGIRVTANVADNAQGVRDFVSEHGDETVFFPLHSFEACAAGRPFLWSADDHIWANEPRRKQRLRREFEELKPKYIALWPDDMFFIYSHDDTDWMLDAIAANYVPVKDMTLARWEPTGQEVSGGHDSVCNGPLAQRRPSLWRELKKGTLPSLGIIAYERRETPVSPVRLVEERPGPWMLSPTNAYSVTWELPAGFTNGYIEVQQKFTYSPAVARRLSKPIVVIRLNGERLRPQPSEGRTRIRNTPEGGDYRFFIPRWARRATMRVTFPGALNPRPESVELSQVRFYQFNFFPPVPYTPTFLIVGY